MNLTGSNINSKINSAEISSSATVINTVAKNNIETKKNKEETTVTKVDNQKTDNKNLENQKNLWRKEDYEEIEKLKEEINKTLKNSNKELQYSIHDRLNQIMVKLIDTETKEVIREFPQEKNLDLLANMLEFSGLLLDVKR